MAYDEALAARVRQVLAAEAPDAGIEERKMMGALAFMTHGTMLGGVDAAGLYIRVGIDGYEAALAEPHVGPMGIGGRAPKGFVSIDPAATRTDDDLTAWVLRGLACASALPRKPGKGR
jgi:hypothetical protein